MALQQQEEEEAGPQQAEVAEAGLAVGDAQQAEPDALTAWFSLKTGILPKVWKCSQAMPCGSVIQCLSLWA